MWHHQHHNVSLIIKITIVVIIITTMFVPVIIIIFRTDEHIFKKNIQYLLYIVLIPGSSIGQVCVCVYVCALIYVCVYVYNNAYACLYVPLCSCVCVYACAYTQTCMCDAEASCQVSKSMFRCHLTLPITSLYPSYYLTVSLDTVHKNGSQWKGSRKQETGRPVSWSVCFPLACLPVPI